MCHSCTQAGSGSSPLVCACCACCSRCACCTCCRLISAAMCDGVRGGRAGAIPLWLESPCWRAYADEGRRSLPSDAAPCSLSWIFRRCAKRGEAGRWTRRRGARRRGAARCGAVRRGAVRCGAVRDGAVRRAPAAAAAACFPWRGRSAADRASSGMRSAAAHRAPRVRLPRPYPHPPRVGGPPDEAEMRPR